MAGVDTLWPRDCGGSLLSCSWRWRSGPPHWAPYPVGAIDDGHAGRRIPATEITALTSPAWSERRRLVCALPARESDLSVWSHCGPRRGGGKGSGISKPCATPPSGTGPRWPAARWTTCGSRSPGCTAVRATVRVAREMARVSADGKSGPDWYSTEMASRTRRQRHGWGRRAQ